MSPEQARAEAANILEAADPEGTYGSVIDAIADGLLLRERVEQVLSVWERKVDNRGPNPSQWWADMYDAMKALRGEGA